MPSDSPAAAATHAVLAGQRIVSLALNLPGPAALSRLAQMGATCIKVEPPARDGAPGDPMAAYAPRAYTAMHEGITCRALDLKTDDGRAALHALLAHADILLTAFRPSALHRLGVSPEALHARFPRVALVSIVGEHGVEAEHPGHDLTYEAAAGLVSDLRLPVAPFADMAGALLVSEAVLRAVLRRQREPDAPIVEEVALADAARFLALPRAWGLMASDTVIGGAHAGYHVYPCRDGRVAIAALEPRLAVDLCRAVGLPDADAARMREPAMFDALAAFFAARTAAQVRAVAARYDLPLAVMPAAAPTDHGAHP